MYAIVDIESGERLAVGTLPIDVSLPDGGVARFTEEGDTRPGHAPRYKAVLQEVVTQVPDYPYVVMSETRSYVEDKDRIERVYAPDLTAYQRAIEDHVDSIARTRGYSNAVSIATYVSSTNVQWQAEATTFITWRDSVWTQVLTTLAAVQAGQESPPTLVALINGLPEIEWPS